MGLLRRPDVFRYNLLSCCAAAGFQTNLQPSRVVLTLILAIYTCRRETFSYVQKVPTCLRGPGTLAMLLPVPMFAGLGRCEVSVTGRECI
jgi:hypothetical protein